MQASADNTIFGTKPSLTIYEVVALIDRCQNESDNTPLGQIYAKNVLPLLQSIQTLNNQLPAGDTFRLHPGNDQHKTRAKNALKNLVNAIEPQIQLLATLQNQPEQQLVLNQALKYTIDYFHHHFAKRDVIKTLCANDPELALLKPRSD